MRKALLAVIGHVGPEQIGGSAAVERLEGAALDLRDVIADRNVPTFVVTKCAQSFKGLPSE